MISTRKFIDNILGENINLNSIPAHMQAISELLNAIRPSSLRDRKIVSMIEYHLKEMRKLMRRQEEELSSLKELQQVSEE